MKVRTTLRPDEDLDVTEAEYTDLKRQGILLREYEGPAVEKRQATARTSEKKEG